MYGGPADLNRIDRELVCGRVVAPEFDLVDLLGTEGLLLVVVTELLLYELHTTEEPPVLDYAAS